MANAVDVFVNQYIYILISYHIYLDPSLPTDIFVDFSVLSNKLRVSLKGIIFSNIKPKITSNTDYSKTFETMYVIIFYVYVYVYF